MAHELAKLMLEQAGNFLDRTEAVKTALFLGMPLREIEDYLDWLEASGRTIESPAVEPDARLDAPSHAPPSSPPHIPPNAPHAVRPTADAPPRPTSVAPGRFDLSVGPIDCPNPAPGPR